MIRLMDAAPGAPRFLSEAKMTMQTLRVTDRGQTCGWLHFRTEGNKTTIRAQRATNRGGEIRGFASERAARAWLVQYNGHKNWNHWNVSLWINNDEALYRLAQSYVRAIHTRWGTREGAAAAMLRELNAQGVTHTPDGAPYSVSSIRAAMRDM